MIQTELSKRSVYMYFGDLFCLVFVVRLVYLFNIEFKSQKNQTILNVKVFLYYVLEGLFNTSFLKHI
jgi:hypothetical protein